MNRAVVVFMAVVALIVLGVAIGAERWIRTDSRSDDQAELVIFSTTDTAVFAPVIADFRQLHPDITLRYELMDADPLYHRFLADTAAGRPQADLLLSTSMDLQVKLVNDGHGTPHVSTNSRSLPSWARWRDEAFGISFEPVVMVFNTRAMQGRRLPQSRAELLGDLRRDPDFWRDRIGTYDISRSGLGYLLASQDARLNSEAGVLIDSFGDAGVFLSDNTADLLRRIEAGDLAMGYNVLGSYARGRVDAGAPITLVYPEDYTLAVSRTAIIPRNAPHAAEAHLFLEYLLSLRGQQILTRESRLNAVRMEIDGPYRNLGAEGAQVGLLKPIALGPGLLVYLDERKHRLMLENWRSAIRYDRAFGAENPASAPAENIAAQ